MDGALTVRGGSRSRSLVLGTGAASAGEVASSVGSLHIAHPKSGALAVSDSGRRCGLVLSGGASGESLALPVGADSGGDGLELVALASSDSGADAVGREGRRL